MPETGKPNHNGITVTVGVVRIIVPTVTLHYICMLTVVSNQCRRICYKHDDKAIIIIIIIIILSVVVSTPSLSVLPARISDEIKSKVKSKAVPLHAMEALGGRGGIAPTHSRPRH
jgi:hypothetical protein